MLNPYGAAALFCAILGAWFLSVGGPDTVIIVPWALYVVLRFGGLCLCLCGLLWAVPRLVASLEGLSDDE